MGAAFGLGFIRGPMLGGLLGTENPQPAARCRGLAAVYSLCVLAQFVIQSTWVLYTAFRFGWGPRENGLSLFVVGAAAAMAQGGLLGLVLKRFGERRAVLFGLSSATVASVLYGLAWVSARNRLDPRSLRRIPPAERLVYQNALLFFSSFC